MKIFRYTFKEFGEMPLNYEPEHRKVAAESAQHARHLIRKQPPQKNRFWQIVDVEIIDLDNTPPGYIPPAWIWKDKRKKKKYRNDLGHCLMFWKQHQPHVYKTDDGRAKVCPGDIRTHNLDRIL